MLDTKENWTPNKDDYDGFHKKLGHKYRVSHRVIAVIRTCFYNDVEHFSRLPDQNFVAEIVKLRKRFKKQITRMNECLRPAKIVYAQLVLKDEISLDKTNVRVNQLNKLLPQLTNGIKRVTLRMALVKYLKYLEQDPQVLREILSTTIDGRKTCPKCSKSMKT